MSPMGACLQVPRAAKYVSPPSTIWAQPNLSHHSTGGKGFISAESKSMFAALSNPHHSLFITEVVVAWRDNPEPPEAPLPVESPIPTDPGTSQASIQTDPGTSQHLEQGKRKRRKESLERSSPPMKDLSTSNFGEITKQPDFVIHATAKDVRSGRAHV